MAEAWRKPFMVEAFTQSPSGVSDPWHSEHYRTVAEARDQARREESEGAIATVWRRTIDDGYEEVLGNE